MLEYTEAWSSIFLARQICCEDGAAESRNSQTVKGQSYFFELTSTLYPVGEKIKQNLPDSSFLETDRLCCQGHPVISKNTQQFERSESTRDINPQSHCRSETFIMCKSTSTHIVMIGYTEASGPPIPALVPGPLHGYLPPLAKNRVRTESLVQS